MGKFCEKCGQINTEDACFCASCGADRSNAEAGDSNEGNDAGTVHDDNAGSNYSTAGPGAEDAFSGADDEPNPDSSAARDFLSAVKQYLTARIPATNFDKTIIMLIAFSLIQAWLDSRMLGPNSYNLFRGYRLSHFLMFPLAGVMAIMDTVHSTSSAVAVCICAIFTGGATISAAKKFIKKKETTKYKWLGLKGLALFWTITNVLGLFFIMIALLIAYVFLGIFSAEAEYERRRRWWGW